MWYFKMDGDVYEGDSGKLVPATTNEDSDNNGGSTDYYELPEGATELQDLIEHKNMNFAIANCFKALYRLDDPEHDTIRDLNKIIWFAEREKKRIGGKE